MRWLSRFISQVVFNALALLAVFYLVSGASFSGSWVTLLEIGAVLGLINFIVKPILKLLLGPLIVLTLGLFSLVINAAILWAVTQFFPVVVIPMGMPLVWATIIVSAVNFIVHLFSHRSRD